MQLLCAKHNWGSDNPYDPCPYCARERVSPIAMDFEEQVLPDLKGAWGLAWNLFTGDFFEKHGFVDKKVELPPSTPQMSQEDIARMRATLEQMRAQQQPVPQPIPPLQPAPTVIDVPLATECLTCGGTRKVGAPGFQIPCPLCAACKTCSGSGMVGRKGHEVPCPLCSKK